MGDTTGVGAPEWIRTPEPGAYLGYGARDFGTLTDAERMFVAGRDRAVTIAESEDPHADYSYDDWALCKLDGLFYAFNTSGCSCPSPSETWTLVKHGTLEEMLDWLVMGAPDGPYKLSSEAFAEFLRKIESAGWTLKQPAPPPRARYDW